MRGDEAHATRVRGHAWFVFRDPATAIEGAGDHPFLEAPGEIKEDEQVRIPEGVEAAWRTTMTVEGLANTSPTTSFLVISRNDEPPTVNPGWDCEPAVLHDDFQLEQKGDRWVRLRRTLRQPDQPGKTLGEFEFEVDRYWEGSGADRGG